MAKQGMKRRSPERKKNELPPVPEIQEQAQSGNDLEMENLLNDWDMTSADRQDFWRKW